MSRRGQSRLSIQFRELLYKLYTVALHYLKLQFMATNQSLLSVFVRLPNGNGSLLTLSPSTPLSKLANTLRTTSIELPQTYRLVIRGQRVKDYSLTLGQLQVKQNSIIHIEPVTINQNSNIKIDVAFLVGGEKWVVKISREETILALKTAIYQLISISPKQQVLVFLGKRLKNHKTLKHYKIGSDSLLSLIIESTQRPLPSEKNLRYDSINLVYSVCSLADKRSGTSNTSLFRSDSINTKKTEDIVPYQISIRDKTQEMQKPLGNGNGLFNSCKNGGDLKDSFTFHSLFQSANLITQHQSFEQDEEEEQIDLGRSRGMLRKIESKKSFEIREDETILQ